LIEIKGLEKLSSNTKCRIAVLEIRYYLLPYLEVHSIELIVRSSKILQHFL